MYKFFKRNSTKLIILCVILFVVVGYSCYTPNKEYFVFKMSTPGGEILVDQNDFASVINGLKPKSVKGTFTTDDLSELVREMKGLWVANMTGMYNRSCSTASQKASRQCIQMNDVLSLIHETNAVKYEGKPVTSKEEWLNAIIDTGFKMFPGSKPTQYEKVDNQVIRAVKDKKSVAVVLGTGQNINR